MADQKVSDLPSLNGADVDAADLLYIVDSSAGTAGSKKITVGQYQQAAYSAGTANGVMYLNGSNVVTTGSGLTFDGTNFATTGTSSATKLIPTGGSATGNGMYLPAANTVALSTNGTERLRLDSAGGVTVGSASTAAGRIDSVTNGYAAFVARASTSGVNQTVDALKAVDSVVGQFANAVYSANSHIWNYAGATEGMRLNASGNLLLGTATANAMFTVNGNVVWNTGVAFAGAAGNAVWTTGFGAQNINASIQASHSIAGANIYSISDVRLKSNIKPIPSGLAFVNEVDAVQFTWKESGIEDTGFIAQDLLKKGFGHLVSAIPDGAMKELVHDDGNVSPAGSRFVVKYDSVVPILCKAIQEQQALIASLTARVAALEQA
jgi:hypothetical protein